jgi:hypothetical protein
MASPTSIAVTLNTWLLVGGAMLIVVSNAARADDPVANPTGGGGSVQLEPVPERAPPRHRRAIFVCHDAPPVVFSDRPCGQLFEQRAINVEATERKAGRAATTSPRPAPASTRPRVEPAPQEERLRAGDERCRKLRDELEKLDDRMRTGYPAREAAKLWNRWRALHSEIYAARC